MRRVWAVALMRVYQHAIDYHAHEEGPEWAKYLRALAFEREWDKRAADGCVKAHLRRKRDRETGDWRRR